MVAFLAIFCSGGFFGAALYIALVQHPAVLEAGAAFALRFFAPMYRRAAGLQSSFAVVGALGGAWAYARGAGVAWLVGALLLFSVPFTLVLIMPVTHRLLASGHEVGADTEALLRRWGALHGVRTILGGLAFAVLVGAAFALAGG